ncbi:MAG: anaerobic ribonucleoside-triphosphate reductase activating protein [Verrucomicrobiota bacterium]
MIRSGKSPVYGHLTGPSMVDYSGRLAAVFFLSGCNFRCGFCHNLQLMEFQDSRLSWAGLDRACLSFSENWVDAAVISGGEPTLCKELPELITFFRNHGWRVKLDTNGSRPDMLKKIIGEIDYVAMDIKTSLERYPEVTGCSDTLRISESIDLIMNAPVDYEFRTTVIESIHPVETIKEAVSLIKGARRYVLQPFVPQPGLPDPSMETLQRTSPDYMQKLAGTIAGQVQEALIRGE